MSLVKIRSRRKKTIEYRIRSILTLGRVSMLLLMIIPMLIFLFHTIHSSKESTLMLACERSASELNAISECTEDTAEAIADYIRSYANEMPRPDVFFEQSINARKRRVDLIMNTAKTLGEDSLVKIEVYLSNPQEGGGKLWENRFIDWNWDKNLGNLTIYEKGEAAPWWYEYSRQLEAVGWTSPVYDDEANTYVLTCCAPIVLENGTNVGGVALKTDIRKLGERLGEVQEYENGFFFLVDGSDRMYCHRDYSDGIALNINRDSGIFRYVLKDVKQAACASRLRCGVFLVASVPSSEIYLTFNLTVFYTLLLSLVAFFLVYVMEILIYRHQTKNLDALIARVKSFADSGVKFDKDLNDRFIRLCSGRDEVGEIARGIYYMRKQNESMLDAMADSNEELQQANLLARQAADEADRANKAKSDFLARMSHEIRTPMNAIIGMTEMLLRMELSDKAREYTAIIKNSGDNLLAIINDILDFSKIEAGDMEIVAVEYNVAALISDVLAVIGIRMKNTPLKLITDISPNLPVKMMGDDVRIRQVLINLLTNAVKYTEKGSVTLSVDSVMKGGQLWLMVSVKDTGMGIRAEDVKKLFGSFTRFDLEINRSKEGTGLGLSITKRLIELMGGEITVDSVYGEGSDFQFSIPQRVIDYTPIGDFEEQRKESLRNVTAFSGAFIAPEARILIVDDNEVNLEVADGLLSEFCVLTERASSGAECLEMLKDDVYFDLIFMDHMMPGMDGIQCLHEIRDMQGDEFYQKVPIVALTANNTAGIRQQYLDMGFSDYLSKPMQMKEVQRVLWEFLPRDLIEDAGKKDLLMKPVPVTADTSPEKTEAGDEIEGIDMKEGLMMVDDMQEIYIKILHTYLKEGRQKMNEIRKSLEEGDIENYTILVHALKSASRNIGAKDLGEHAFAHEMKGKEGDYEYLKGDYEALLAEYTAILDAIESYLQKEEAE